MKRERILYGCWLAVFALLVVAYSLGHDRMPLWGAARTIGLLTFAMVDILYLLLPLIGPKENRNPAALRRLLCFAGATILYIYYCFELRDLLHGNSYRDAIAAGSLLCIAMLLGGGREKRIDTPEE